MPMVELSADCCLGRSGSSGTSPTAQDHPHDNLKVVLPDIPTLPLDAPDVWWTAAATISPEFHNDPEPGRRAKDVRKLNKAPLSSQPGRKRAASPTKQEQWRWEGTVPAAGEALVGLDADDDFGEIKITVEHTWSPNERSEFSTGSSKRRKNAMEQNFKRRFFTNNPDKARRISSHELSAMSPAMCLVCNFRSSRRFTIKSSSQDFKS